MTPDADDIQWQKSLSGLTRKDLGERLLEAVEAKSLWRAQAALDAGADANAGGSQALRRASVTDQFAMVKLLVEAGAKVGVNDEEPLSWAARNGNAAIVEYLLSAGADEKSYGGRRAKSWAEDYKQANVVALLNHADDIRERKALSGASFAESVAALLEQGGSIPMDEVKSGGVRSAIYLFVAGDAGKIDLLFQPKDWVGQGDDMKKLWDKLPKRYQEQVDLSAKISALGAHTAKQRKPPPKLKL